MNAIEHLEECKWVRPPYYGGYSPDGDYCSYSRARDSEILANTNYERILEDLVALAEGFPPPDGDDEYESPWVEDFRAGHWAVGWVEHIIVRADSPEPILQAAGEIYCALQDLSLIHI